MPMITEAIFNAMNKKDQNLALDMTLKNDPQFIADQKMLDARDQQFYSDVFGNSNQFYKDRYGIEPKPETQVLELSTEMPGQPETRKIYVGEGPVTLEEAKRKAGLPSSAPPIQSVRQVPATGQAGRQAAGEQQEPEVPSGEDIRQQAVQETVAQMNSVRQKSQAERAKRNMTIVGARKSGASHEQAVIIGKAVSGDELTKEEYQALSDMAGNVPSTAEQRKALRDKVNSGEQLTYSERRELAGIQAEEKKASGRSLNAKETRALNEYRKTNRQSASGQLRDIAVRALTTVEAKIDKAVEEARKGLVNKGITTPEEYKNAVDEAVTKESNPQVYGIVRERLYENPPPEVVEDERTAGKLKVQRKLVDEEKRRQAEEAYIAGYPPEEQNIVRQALEAGDAANPHVRAVNERIDEQKRAADAKRRGEEYSAGREIKAGKFDPLNPVHADYAVKNGLVTEGELDAVISDIPEPDMPADAQTGYYIEDKTLTGMIDSVADKASSGNDIIDAATQVVEQNGANVTYSDEAYGKKALAADIAKRAQRKILDSIKVRPVQRAAIEAEQQTKDINEFAGTATKISPERALNELQVLIANGQRDISSIDARDMAADRITQDYEARFGKNTPEHDEFLSVVDDWRNGTVTNDRQFRPVMALLENQREAFETARATLAAKQATDIVEKRMYMQNLYRNIIGYQHRGYAAVTETDPKTGLPEIKMTFNLRDPVEADMFVKYQNGGMIEKAEVTDDIKTHRRLRTKAKAFAEEQKTYLTSGTGLVVVRQSVISGQDENGAKTYKVEMLPKIPESEDDWDEYFEYLKKGTAGAPDIYAELYDVAMHNKTAWKVRKGAELDSKFDLPAGTGMTWLEAVSGASLKDSGMAYMEDRAAASSSDALKMNAVLKNTKSVNRIISSGAVKKPETIIPDVFWRPKQEIADISAAIPDELKFDTIEDYNAADKEGRIPSGTYVWINNPPEGKSNLQYSAGTTGE